MVVFSKGFLQNDQNSGLGNMVVCPEYCRCISAISLVGACWTTSNFPLPWQVDSENPS